MSQQHAQVMQHGVVAHVVRLKRAVEVCDGGGELPVSSADVVRLQRDGAESGKAQCAGNRRRGSSGYEGQVVGHTYPSFFKLATRMDWRFSSKICLKRGHNIMFTRSKYESCHGNDGTGLSGARQLFPGPSKQRISTTARTRHAIRLRFMLRRCR